ncbi:phosphotransferase family protein [Pedobacter nyackensis]|uniref:Phosphotransferase enzyme family protein n=1 Tax=Pedobacter nyackensis TaxID=475255 RepID=A0A1W2F2U7_9SPHI|nr:phosphotransferase [Pedobacter nyackensis]SMD16264.1 Phosphotransferase enzyme family protein [Pedobacter nyackensis]
MISEYEIRQLIEQYWGAQPVSIETVYRGGMNFVYEINLGDSKIMLKVHPFSRASVAEKEYSVLKCASENGVKVPKVITCGIHKNLGYIFYHNVPGENLLFEKLDSQQQDVFSMTLVKNLKNFSELASNHFGSVTEQESTYHSWKAFLQATVSEGLASLKSVDAMSTNEFKSIANYIQHQLSLNKNWFTGMVWGDVKSENIIVSKGELAAILDFESCFYGDPVLSLGYLFAKEGRSSFYVSVAKHFKNFIPFKEEDVYFYALIRLLRISKYLNSPLPTGKARDPIATYFKGISEAINDIV